MAKKKAKRLRQAVIQGKPQPGHALEKYFFIDVSNGSIEEHDTAAELIESMEDNDDLRENYQSQNGISDECVVIRGRRVDFDASFGKLSIKLRGDQS